MKAYAKDAHDRIRETYNTETADGMIRHRVNTYPEAIRLLEQSLDHLDGCSHGGTGDLYDAIDAFLSANRGRE